MTNFHLYFSTGRKTTLFQHCCSDKISKLTLPGNLTFKYSRGGIQLQYAIYRDVGYFDQCLPFWKCQRTYLKIFETQLFVAACEMTDLTKLYKERLWKLTVWKYSLLQTILPWFLILEGVVISVAVAIFPLTWKLAPGISPENSWRNHLVPTGKIWLFSIWGRLLMDWGHLYLLAMIGNGLIEAMRRQSVYTVQSKVFFDYSILYLVLFIILSAASSLQQLAYWIGACMLHKELQSRPKSRTDEDTDQCTGKHDQPCNEDGSNIELASTSHQEVRVNEPKCNDEANAQDQDDSASSRQLSNSKWSSIKKLRENFRYLSTHVVTLGNDYKWQPIAGQLAILFSMGSFLTSNEASDDEDVWGALLGYILTAGCVWIGMYAIAVFLQRAYYVFNFFMRLWDDTEKSTPREHSVTITSDTPLITKCS